MFRKAKLICIGLLFLSFKSLAQEKKYFGQTEIGILFGKSEEQWDGSRQRRFDVSFMTFHGAHITKSHVVGFSLGIDQYDEISVIPVALGWRGFLGKDDKPKLFGGLDIGGGSTILEKKIGDQWSKSWYEGGFLVSPSVGISFPSKKDKTALSFSFAYKRQQISHYWGTLIQQGSQVIKNDKLPPGYNSLTENNFLFRSFVFRAGLMF
ncbi:hypothetical protein [Algoriphagus winogradskyi]|uniref:Outer membrane protein beta-barrel domain-containing protein n=1 Tax=Algoriphagus winogradskyi TaxID=237017 RepID=A0ABY1NCU6_9BACT|nr:hypothetical protein [Algoriphagus winogradskyi]SMP06381.1 hypothetical protein SAMN06265367_101466 [Algoriphagus winogradskyi]